MRSTVNYRQIYPLALTILVSAVLYILSEYVSKEVVTNLLSRFGVLAAVVFILLNTLTYIIAPLSNTPLLLSGYFVFGQESIFYIGLAMAVSFVSNYWISRIWGKSLVQKLVGKNNLEKVENMIENYDSLSWFIPLRVFEGAWHKFVSYAFGLSQMGFLLYLMISLLCLLPYIIIWYILTGKVDSPLTFTLITQVLGILPPVVFISVVFVVKKLIR